MSGGRTSLRRIVAAAAVIVLGGAGMIAAAAPAQASVGAVTALSNPSPDPYGLSSQGLYAAGLGPKPPTTLLQVLGTVGGVLTDPLGFPNLGGFAGIQLTTDSPINAGDLAWAVTDGPDVLPLIPGVLGTPFEAGGSCGTVSGNTPIFPYTTIDSTHPLCILNQGGLPLIEAYGGTDTINIWADKDHDGVQDSDEKFVTVHATYSNEPEKVAVTPSTATLQTDQCNTVYAGATDAPNNLLLGIPNILQILKGGLDNGGRAVPKWKLHVQITQSAPNGQAPPSKLQFCNQFAQPSNNESKGVIAGRTVLDGDVLTGERGEPAPIGIYSDKTYPISVQAWWDYSPNLSIDSGVLPSPLCGVPVLLTCDEPASDVVTYNVQKGGADGVTHLTISTDSPNAFTGSPVNGTITVSNDLGPSVGVTPRVQLTGANGGDSPPLNIVVGPSDVNGITRFTYTPTKGGTDTINAWVEQSLGGTNGRDPSEPQGQAVVRVTLTPTNVALAFTAHGSLAGGEVAVAAGQANAGDASHSILPTSQATETYTATVTDTQGEHLPRQGVTVTFAIPAPGGRVSGGAVGGTSADDATLSVASAVTNSNGVATVTLTNPSPVAGDAFRVIATIGGTPVSTSAWELYQTPSIPPTPDPTNGALGTGFPTTTGIITVDPPVVTTKIGSSQPFKASVHDQFGAVKSGVAVLFTVTAGRNACTDCTGADVKTATTDANGNAGVVLSDSTGPIVGGKNFDDITVAADLDGKANTNGDQTSTIARRYYTTGEIIAAGAEGGIGTNLKSQFGPAPTYAPVTDDNSANGAIDYQHEVGDQTPLNVFFTARTSDNVPLYGRTMQVTSTGVGAIVDPNGNLAQLTAQNVVIGPNGFAQVKALSIHSGTETLSATLDAQRIDLTINWSDHGGQRNITVTPTTANAVSGGTTTIVAKATDVWDNIVPDAPVTFTISGPGTFSDGSTTVTSATGADGTLLVRLLSGQTGVTTVTATMTGTEVGKGQNDPIVGGTPGNNQATSTVTVAPPVPASDANTTLTFSPSSSAAVGSTITAIGTVKDANGNPLVGKRVSMAVAGVVADSNNNLITDDNGRVSFAITGTRQGTGAVTMHVFSAASAVEVTKNANVMFGSLYPKPVLRQSNGGGSVTLDFFVDPHYVGKTVYFFRRSGITGQVVPLGAGQVNSYGHAYRTFNARHGQILALYGKMPGTPDIVDPYSNSVQFKVK